MVGLLSGALTSTPAFSASKAAVGLDLEALVSVGYGISYLFGFNTFFATMNPMIIGRIVMIAP